MTSAEAGGGAGAGASHPDLPSFRSLDEEVVHRGFVITLTRATFLDPEGVPFDATWSAIPAPWPWWPSPTTGR